MNSIFSLVSSAVTAREAAEYYDLRVGRNGMAVCPFHGDRHPSMKLDERYVPDPAVFLQAISDTDGRLMLTARAPYRLVLKCSIPNDQALAAEGLKVLRKLVKRSDEVTENKQAEGAEQ